MLLPSAVPAQATDVVARRALASGTILAEGDLQRAEGVSPEGRGLGRLAGLRLTRRLAPGEVLLPGDLALPHAVRRNGRISLVFRRGGLAISTSGRALSDGVLGERVSVINLSSGVVVDAMVTGPGMAAVSP